ncbi:MAG: peptidoglycan bridge formation glycyltransferase FemA/FemB family protein [Myxacorys chilensis ATA2-1-KO14]|jgi:lipid II:glycine glycyltransferase (peptidoglycan interpeptide bridge formation enzyme)|nr:peptidoglycan bridge formation glycyltransferase FemA/FemB family protein [Myxacorys chilensis ATA2-1-KO14]
MNKQKPVENSTSLSIRELHLSDRFAWKKLNQSLVGSCFMQSWAWATFKELEGYRTFKYGVFDQALVGGCIFYVYPRSHSANLLIAPGAPLIRPGYTSQAIELLVRQAERIAQEVRTIALRVEPLWAEKPSALNQFVRAPVDLLPSETLIIDLHPTETEIFAQMKPKGRYNIRLSQRHGVTTQFTTDLQKISMFYELFWETVQRQTFFGEPYRFFINLCQTLFAENMAELGFAMWNGEILSAVLIVYWCDRATYLYGGRSDAHGHVMANYALHWDAIKRAKAKGCQLYDFYGYTQNPNHSYAKFSQFKRQFGGTPVTTIGAQDYFFYNQFADTLIGLINRTIAQ